MKMLMIVFRESFVEKGKNGAEQPRPPASCLLKDLQEHAQCFCVETSATV